MFAKDEKAKKLYQDNWNKLVKYRGYTAVVEGIPEKEQDTITLYLKENRNLKVYPSKDGEKAITKYKVTKSNNKYSLLDIEILTGKKNQIRATMEYIKHPVVNDPVYGKRKIIDNSGQCLHAKELGFKHPKTNKYMLFTSKLPESFTNILDKFEEGEQDEWNNNR